MNPDEVEIVLQWFRGDPIYWYLAPSGRPHINPLAPLLLFPFATTAEPAIWVVRMQALLAGVAVLPLVFLQASRLFDRSTALYATLLVGSLPAHIAYSRLGWDPAFVPLTSAAAVFFAYRRRWLWMCGAAALLVLIHPVSVLILPVLAAPIVADLLVRTDHSGRSRARGLLIAGSVVAYVLLILVALRLFAGGASVPGGPTTVGAVLARASDATAITEFLSGFWRIMFGSLVYAGFAGGGDGLPSLWPGRLLACVWVAGAWLLARRQRRLELAMLVGLGLALFAQYLVQDTMPVLVLNERYVLWALVPACLVLLALIEATGALTGLQRFTPVVVSLLTIFWLGSFWLFYLRPFETSGGSSLVLDYRTSNPEPKVQVLDVVQRERRHPELPSLLFVGETRLELGLLYLASARTDIEVKNLGYVGYRYYQEDDHSDLAEAYGRYADRPQDVFFVDYAWDDGLSGSAPFIPPPVRSSLEKVTAPWKADRIRTIHTPDGRALIVVWRLTRTS